MVPKFKYLMYQLINSRTKSQYQKKLVTLLLLASLPGMVIGFFMFVVSKVHIEHELKEIHKNHLYDTMKTIEEQFSYVEQLLAHWAFDPSFNESFKNIDLANKYKEVHELYQSLMIMEGSNHLIDRVELYVNEPSRIVFTKDQYRHLEDKKQIETYTNLLDNKRSLFWKEGYENRYSPLQLIHKIPGGIEQPYGAIIVSLNKEKMANLLKSPYDQGTAFLLTDSEQWLFGTGNKNEATTMDQEILKEIHSIDQATDTFLFEWKNKTYSVTYETFFRLGKSWIYASAAPLSTITAPVVIISKWMIGLSCGILILAIILSILVSKKLYSPLDQLMKKVNGQKSDGQLTFVKNEFELIETKWNNLSKESHELKTQLENQLPHMREGFLLQLINGYLYTLKEAELKERMQQFGWETEGKQYMTIFMQLYGFRKLEENSKEDEGLYTFVAANVVKELLQSIDFNASVINFHDLSLCVLLEITEDMEFDSVNSSINDLCYHIIKGINQTTQMDVSLCISRMTESIKAIPSLFEEAKVSLRFRNLQERNQIIEIGRQESLNEAVHFEYPFDIEREITHAIRLRVEEDAVLGLHDFVLQLSNENVSEALMKQGMFQLLGRILEVEMQSGLTANSVLDGANFYEQLCHMREPEEMEEWFCREVIAPLIGQLSQNQDERMKLMIEEVMVLMQEKYMEEISLDYCADHIKISPSVLSKVFKEFTGLNFIDYLTSIRLTKAKELLVETDMKINDIAEMIGYKNSYFNRLFKKHEGYTPGQFREIRRDHAS